MKDDLNKLAGSGRSWIDENLTEHTYKTPAGVIHYWTNALVPGRLTLVLLPGLTADHRLFDRQARAFAPNYNIFVWDAPGHASSRPFTLDFTLMDKTTWLHDILENEHLDRIVLIGQSMGGYVSQCFMEKYPGQATGFISIDSAPLKRCYVTGAEIWLLKRTEPMYRAFPWGYLKNIAVKGVSETAYGRALMRAFMDTYTKDEYCRLAGHGYSMLAEAMEADLPYRIDCPALLICGMKDQAGSAKDYNRRWAKKESLPIIWLENTGHNANTDRPKRVNSIIRNFIRKLPHTW